MAHPGAPPRGLVRHGRHRESGPTAQFRALARHGACGRRAHHRALVWCETAGANGFRGRMSFFAGRHRLQPPLRWRGENQPALRLRFLQAVGSFLRESAAGDMLLAASELPAVSAPRFRPAGPEPRAASLSGARPVRPAGRRTLHCPSLSSRHEKILRWSSIGRSDRGQPDRQGMPLVASLNMRIPDMWTRLWSSQFLLRRAQYFPTHTYEGHINTALRGAWDLRGGLVNVDLPLADSIRINSQFSLARVGSPWYLRAVPKQGWSTPERVQDSNARRRWSLGNCQQLSKWRIRRSRPY